MKSCPTCRRGYPDDAGFCPADGTGLIAASLVPAASADDARLGTRLCNRYELRRVVADGGMGRVYEGIDKQDQRRIAVKILHSDVARDNVALERFKREYEISSQLPHEHIVKVLDFQRDDVAGVWLLVMEFLEGEELGVVLKRDKTLTPERLVRMLAQVAIGLDEAHARNYIHRDLKPDNVFLCGTRDGDVVKLLDFGSVKDKNNQSKKLTVMGTTIGSPYYMAPEQAQGLETLDARADVFAMGAIAYESICGKVPFGGQNGPQILLAIMTKEPKPITEMVPGLPQALEYVMEEALAKNPNVRFGSLGKLADAVGRAYGLVGEHRTWAYQPETILAAEIERGLAATRTTVEADPFAAPPGGPGGAGPGAGHQAAGHQAAGHQGAGHQGGGQGFGVGAPTPGYGSEAERAQARAMDAAFEATRAADFDQSQNLTQRGPNIGLIVGIVVAVVLLLGAVSFFVFAR